MSDAEFESSSIQRAWEPPEEVVVPYALAHHPILQPEDYGVLIRLLLRDPGKPAATAKLAAEFQATGWKMGDSRLRGVMDRLKKAGHVRRDRDGYDPATGRPKWAFAVYRNPANNPDHASGDTAAASQARPIRWISTDRPRAPRSDALDSNVYAGQSDPLESNGSASNALVSDALDSNVYAGQSDPLESTASAVFPPTPPLSREEEDSSSLGPSTAAGGVAGLDEAAVTAAREFLALLPGRWACGRKTASLLAPLLAEAVAVQGWALGPALVAQLTRRARSKNAEVAAVLGERIEDLPLYRATRAPVPGEQRDQARGPGALQLPFDGPAAAQQAPAGASTPAPQQPGLPDVPVEQVARARALLGSLSAPWAIGPGEADRLAPLLAATAAERGWEFGEELRQQLMSNPGGGSNYLWLLEHKRIQALPVRRKAAARNGISPRQAAIAACSRCDAYGQYEIGSRIALCSHDAHPDSPGVPAQGSAHATEAPAAPAASAGEARAPRAQAPAGMCARHPGFHEGHCGACMKAEREAARAAAADTDPTLDTDRVVDPVGEVGVSADLAAYVQGLADGAAADDAARRRRPALTRQERDRLAAEQEQARRHEAHNHVLNANA
ncbi:hypothetical protein AB0M86_29320 [Streptomyces sp. NPDC051639]|uniref:hypothetical protein n=1 Tax=Streptomyces sp. NPDC051639 TaxID=3155671 RepID=UPI00341B1621